MLFKPNFKVAESKTIVESNRAFRDKPWSSMNNEETRTVLKHEVYDNAASVLVILDTLPYRAGIKNHIFQTKERWCRSSFCKEEKLHCEDLESG